jgi:hypothetical protein
MIWGGIASERKIRSCTPISASNFPILNKLWEVLNNLKILI